MCPPGPRNPVFATYVVAASIMVLKALAMAWLTVWRMMQAKGGFRSPEGLRRTPLNPHPDRRQLEIADPGAAVRGPGAGQRRRITRILRLASLVRHGSIEAPTGPWGMAWPR
jgi:hypothetical protein